jgi:hypothetical protein
MRNITTSQHQQDEVGYRSIMCACRYLATTTLDHVRHQCPWSTSEANQRNFAFEFVACQCNGIKHVLQRCMNINARSEFIKILRCIKRRWK